MFSSVSGKNIFQVGQKNTLLVDAYQFILLRAKTDFLCMVDGVGTMATLDALKQRAIVVAILGFHLSDEVDTSLIKCHGVGRGKDADVFQKWCGGIGIAIAIDGHVVHHIDIEDAFTVSEVIGDCGLRDLPCDFMNRLECGAFGLADGLVASSDFSNGFEIGDVNSSARGSIVGTSETFGVSGGNTRRKWGINPAFVGQEIL